MHRLRQHSLLVVVITSSLVAVAIAAISHSPNQTQNSRRMELEQKEKNDATSLREKVELAKIRGQKKVDANPVVSLYPAAKTVDEMDRLLSSHSLILAELIDTRGYLSDSSHSQRVRSWYKFKIVDSITLSPPQRSFAERQIPTDLLPVKADELLVPFGGGTTIVDGVEVTQSDQSTPRIEKSKRYLLLVSFDPVSRIAEPALGGQSILPVNSDNSLNPNSDKHLLQETIKTFHNGSLDQLKRNKQK